MTFKPYFPSMPIWHKMVLDKKGCFPCRKKLSSKLSISHILTCDQKKNLSRRETEEKIKAWDCSVFFFRWEKGFKEIYTKRTDWPNKNQLSIFCRLSCYASYSIFTWEKTKDNLIFASKEHSRCDVRARQNTKQNNLQNNTWSQAIFVPTQ